MDKDKLEKAHSLQTSIDSCDQFLVLLGQDKLKIKFDSGSSEWKLPASLNAILLVRTGELVRKWRGRMESEFRRL